MSSPALLRKINLARYVAVLALDPERLRDFLADPVKQAQANGLNKEETARLTHPAVRLLFQALRFDTVALPDDQVGDGRARQE